jgi:hypothetical protein
MPSDLIYICNNNGSDTRVSKELNTLLSRFSVHFLGFEKAEYHQRSTEQYASHDLIRGTIRSIGTVLSLYRKARRLISDHPRASIHIVNEQLAALLWPLLIGRHVVIDSFDSVFLRMNLPHNRGYVFKRAVYGLAKHVIVTDCNRFELLPDFTKGKAIVIPNVPFRCTYPEKLVDSEKLTLCYFGSLSERRGSSFVMRLLEACPRVRCIAAGWVMDDYTKELIKHERVEFLGSLPQSEVNKILALKGDYLVAIYPLDNQNNINASPNKIYDSIHTKTPLIITSGVRAAREVILSRIGLAVDTEAELDFPSLVAELMDRRASFSFSDEAVDENSWEAFEAQLCAAHGLALADRE